LLAVRATLPVKSVKELVALAKSKPGALTYASTGTGGSGHLAMELFRLQAGIDMMHVPYKGSSTAVPDLIGGQVDMMFSSSIALLPHMKSGRIRALGITSPQRSALLPELPTIAESGLPGFEAIGWSALLAPAKTPRAIVTLLNTTVVKIAQMPEVVERLAAQGAAPLTSTPEQARSTIQQEVVKWQKVIKAAGIKAE
jgi:tripartite-type tricarboxylate transporter receptor subunit TctC